MPRRFKWLIMPWMSLTAKGSMPAKFIEENESRVGHQTAGNFDAAPFPAGQLDAQSVPQLGDGKLFHQGFGLLVLLLFAELRRFQQGQEIVLYGQLAEDRRFLRQIADAVGRPLVNGKLVISLPSMVISPADGRSMPTIM